MNILPIRIRQGIALFGDAVVLYAALAAVIAMRYGTPRLLQELEGHARPFTLVFLLWMVLFFINGLYDLPRAKNTVDFYTRMLQAVGMNTLLSMGFFYVIPYFAITPKTNLALTIALSTVGLLLWRTLFNTLIVPRAILNRVLFIGAITALPELKHTLNKRSGLGYHLVAVLATDEREKETFQEEGVTLYTDAGKIRSIVDHHHVGTVVLGPEFAHNETVHKELYELLFWGTEIVDWTRLYEDVLGRVPLHHLDEQWFWANVNEKSKRLYDLLRSGVDVLLALVVLAVFALLLPLVALAIVLESGRPVFYTQLRVGSRGKPFRLIKLRSMKKLSGDGSAETSEPEFTTANDKRITAVGRIIRAVRIDEMPQAVNVIKREMNFIGPRPERPPFVEQLQRDMIYYGARHLVKPGITGWAQVNKPLHSSLKENLIKLEYDLYYIKNRSFLLDLAILLRTINIIVRGMGK